MAGTPRYSLGRVIGVALISGLCSWAFGAIQSTGAYREKVDQLEAWKEAHEKEVKTSDKELTEVATELREVNRRLQSIEKKFDERWYHERK